MGLIRRQASLSTIITIIGFSIGAFNLLIFFPRLMSKEQIGLTKLMMEAGTAIAAMCTFGVLGIVNKFFPYYKDNLPSKKNDLAGISLLICTIGYFIFLFILFFFKDFIVRKMGGKSPLFIPYYYLLIPFSFFSLLFSWIEVFAWGFKRSVLTSSFKETYFRIYTSILLGVLALSFINFRGFMLAYSFAMAIPAFITWYILKKRDSFSLSFTASKVTQRLKKPLRSFFGYAFSRTILGMLILSMDTFFIAGFSKDGLGDVAIFTLATYFIMILDIPFRSIISIATPVLAESWKNKDYDNIRLIYSKSSMNLLIAGFFLFGCIWINLINLPKILPPSFKIEHQLILVLSMAKLFDLGTGLNGHILVTSSSWKFEFHTNIIISILALIINGLFIKHMGLIGAAWGTLTTIIIYNSTRFIFLWHKYGLQPFSYKNLILLATATTLISAFYFLPALNNWIADALLKTTAFSVTYFAVMWLLNLSDDIKQVTYTILKRTGLRN